MADVKKNVLVNHSNDKMFRLVDQIEDYPLFLPWCGGSKVIERTDEITRASIHIQYRGVNQSFTTQNTKDYSNRIDLKLIDGPFKVLEGYWIFTKINEVLTLTEPNPLGEILIPILESEPTDDITGPLVVVLPETCK